MMFVFWVILSICSSIINCQSQEFFSQTTNITRNLANPKYELCFMTKVHLLSQLYSCHLSEWIQYHQIMGVQHFYILDDCSPKESKIEETIQPFIDKKLVTLIRLNDPSLCSSESKTTQIVYETYVKQHCDWVGNIDMDEFIYYRTIDHENKHDIKEYLRTLTNQAGHRLLWWMIGADNHEKQPPGLVIENYFHGWFEPAHIKTIAKTKYINTWSYQLHPFYNQDLPFPSLHGLSHKQYYESTHAHASEYLVFELHHYTEHIPIANLFLFHYRFYSWEEYNAQKVALPKIASGAPNDWKVNAKEKWDQSNERKGRLSPNIPYSLASLVRKELSQYNHTNKYIEFTSCYRYWLDTSPSPKSNKPTQT